MVAGLETITAGAINYRGEEISRSRKEIGMVFQEISLLPWRNVLDNVPWVLSSRVCHEAFEER